MEARQPGGQDGSILLPVILLLMLVATAATAMTVRARTSLREAATRRDRLVLQGLADGAARGTAFALAGAAAARAAPPFPLDGTAQACRLADGRSLVVSVQDEGGLVDLNKAGAELVSTVLRRSGLSAPEAGALAQAIAAHRADAPRTQPAPAKRPTGRGPAAAPAETRDFILADELGDLPGVDIARFLRLRPLFTTANRSAGVDPGVAGPALRALVPPRELASPAFESMTTPSNHADFTITATVASPTGQRFARLAAFRLDPDSGPLGRFTAWDAPPSFDPLPEGGGAASCRRLAALLED